MFGNMFGDLEAKKSEMASQLKQTVVSAETQGIKIVGNAAREVSSVSIDPTLLQDAEILEDMMAVAINRFVAQATQIESEQAEQMMKAMLPPGFGGMFK
jgi:DNA-binding protein YbaB